VYAVILKITASVKATIGVEKQIGSGELIATLQSPMLRLCIYNPSMYRDILGRNALITDYTVVPVVRYNSPSKDVHAVPVSAPSIMLVESGTTPEIDMQRCSEIEYGETWWHPLKDRILFALEQGYLVSFKIFHSITVQKRVEGVAPIITAITFHTLARIPRHRMPLSLENYMINSKESMAEELRMSPPVAITISFQFLDKLFFNLAVYSAPGADRGKISGMLTAMSVSKTRAFLNQLLIIEPNSISVSSDDQAPLASSAESSSSQSYAAALDFVAHRFTSGAYAPVNSSALVEVDYTPKTYVTGYLFADNSTHGPQHLHTVKDLYVIIEALCECAQRDVLFPHPSKFLVVDATGNLDHRSPNEYQRYCLCYVIDTRMFMDHKDSLLNSDIDLLTLRQWLHEQSLQPCNVYGIIFEGPIDSEMNHTEFVCNVTATGTLQNITRAVTIEKNMNFSYFINFSRYNNLEQDVFLHEEWKKILWMDPCVRGGGYLVIRKLGSSANITSQVQHQFVYVPPDVFATNSAVSNGWGSYERFLTNHILLRFGGDKGTGQLNTKPSWELCGVVAIRSQYGCSVDANEYSSTFNWKLFFKKTKKVWMENKVPRNFLLLIPTTSKWHVYRYQTFTEATKWMDADEKYEAMFSLMQLQIEASTPTDYQQIVAPFVFAETVTYVRSLHEMKHFDISSDKQLLLGEGFLPYNMPVVHGLLQSSLGREPVIHPAIFDKNVKSSTLVGYDVVVCPAHVETLVDDLKYSPLLAEFMLRASGTQCVCDATIRQATPNRNGHGKVLAAYRYYESRPGRTMR